MEDVTIAATRCRAFFQTSSLATKQGSKQSSTRLSQRRALIPPKLEFTEGTHIDAFQVQAKRGFGNDGGLARNCKPLAMSQGVGRLCAAIVQRPSLRAGSLGFRGRFGGRNSVTISRRGEGAGQAAGATDGTPISRNPTSGQNRLIAGDVFFFRALEWILAHEVGHIVSGHDDRAWTAQQSREEEREADRFATCYVIGGLAADPRRQPGERPSQDEIELERRAIAAGLGLVWVAIYEDTRTQY